jgi:hypothetical protein
MRLLFKGRGALALHSASSLLGRTHLAASIAANGEAVNARVVLPAKLTYDVVCRAGLAVGCPPRPWVAQDCRVTQCQNTKAKGSAYIAAGRPA